MNGLSSFRKYSPSFCSVQMSGVRFRVGSAEKYNLKLCSFNSEIIKKFSFSCDVFGGNAQLGN